MGMFVGIALGGAEWCFSQLESTAAASKLIGSRNMSLPETCLAQPLLKSLNDALSLKSDCLPGHDSLKVRRSEAETSKDTAQRLRKSGIPAAFKEHVLSEFDFAGTVGLTHPYGMSPAARRGLPALVGWNAIEHHRTDRNVRVETIHPIENEGIERLCAVEAPFAVALELIAGRHIMDDDRLIVLGESPEGLEATSVHVRQSGEDWTMTADAYASGSLDTVIPFCEARCQSISQLRVITFPEIPETQRVTATLTRPGLEVIDLPLAAQAAGAARYAALCMETPVESVLRRPGPASVQFVSVAPFPIGVCGVDSHGKLLWCPVVEAGQTLGVPIAPLTLAGATLLPSRLILAECVQPDRSPGEWVTDPAQLRWYAELPLGGLRTSPEGQVHISLDNSTAAWSYGWSDPFLRGTFVVAS